MSQMLRSQGETLDEATGLVQSHIKKNEPIWKLDYFDDKPEPTSFGHIGKTRAQSDFERMQNRQQALQDNAKRMNDYYNKGFYLNPEQWKDVGKATLDGLHSGMDTVVDKLTFGAYGLLDKYADNSIAAKRRKMLQEEADLAGVGFLNDLAHKGLSTTGYLIANKAIAMPALKYIKKQHKNLKHNFNEAKDLGEDLFYEHLYRGISGM